MSERTTSASWVRGIAEKLRASGLDVQTLFDEAGLDMAALNHPDTRYATEKISVLWELAAARAGNPGIGLALPHLMQPAGFDVLAYAMMTQPSLHAALELMVRYLRVVSDAAGISLRTEPQGGWVAVDLFGGNRPVPRQRIEFVLVTLLTFFRWVTGQDIRPLAVEFTPSEPAVLVPFREAFQCPLRFGAAQNRMLLSHADLGLPLPTANPVLAELHHRYAGERLGRLDSANISSRTREVIIRLLPKGDPLRADIAAALCIGERTLQRRLQEEGTSYHELVDDTRRELAHHYLGQPHLMLSQAAYLLGFSDQSTFCRACKRWFDMSPGQYRSGLGESS